MKFYVLRHGEAVPHGDPQYREADRPLTPKGRDRTRELAEALRRWELDFDAILTSPLPRASETAEIVAKELKIEDRLRYTPALSPTGSLEKLLHEINALHPAPGSVMVVGHEPSLSSLIALLCSGGPDLSLELKKGGLCRLEVGRLGYRKCATLEWLITPRLIQQAIPIPRQPK